MALSKARFSKRRAAPAASATIRCFYLPKLGKTMAEIDLETKLSLSHRGRALAALLPKLDPAHNSRLPTRGSRHLLGNVDAKHHPPRIMQLEQSVQFPSLNLRPLQPASH